MERAEDALKGDKLILAEGKKESEEIGNDLEARKAKLRGDEARIAGEREEMSEESRLIREKRAG